MNSEERADLLKLIRNSGFPFQLRVEQEVFDTNEKHGWEVVKHEYPWHDTATGDEGFIDLILGRPDQIKRVIVECKKTKGGQWVFLTAGASNEQTRARCMWLRFDLGERRPIRTGWHDFQFWPASKESEFCVVRGSGDKDRPMLERLGDTLFQSIEFFAQEEAHIGVLNEKSVNRYYLPAVVTNARLFVCRFDVNLISLREGEIPAAQFEEIPYIRFTKSMATKIEWSGIKTMDEAYHQRVRTLFVIQAESLSDFLEGAGRLSAFPNPAW